MRELKKYRNKEGLYQDKVDFLEEYVPDSGASEYVETELFRAASKIYYDLYNNGFGNQWESVIEYVNKHNHVYKNTEDQVLNIDDAIIRFLQICSVGVAVGFGDSIGDTFIQETLDKEDFEYLVEFCESDDIKEIAEIVVTKLVDDVLSVILLDPETWTSIDYDMWDTNLSKLYSILANEYSDYIDEDEEDDSWEDEEDEDEDY